jgi:hypothetical protein
LIQINLLGSGIAAARETLTVSMLKYLRAIPSSLPGELLMTTVSPSRLREDEDIARELEQVAELVRHHPELNHHAADRPAAIARDIRADIARAKITVPRRSRTA